jgi:hypothetical protein
MGEENLTWQERKQGWLDISMIDEAEFDAKWKFQSERQAKVPKVGTRAPDFKLSLLNNDLKISDESVSLKMMRGKTVALLFCSYT